MRLSLPNTPPATAHTGHLLTAVGFMVLALLGVGLVEQFQRRRADGAGNIGRALWGIIVAGSCSGCIHLAVLPSHWREAELYGLFFLLAGTIQLTYGALLLVRPTRGLMLLNGVVNVGLILVWAQSRIIGVPIGPAAGLREPVGVEDSVSSLLELAVLVGTVALLQRPRSSKLAA
jgi:hypothetical protein